ncbi:abortive infection family protein [Corynebacterium urogenitale]|nr:abortive infection family protein [Corynebacterium urogenitale]
MNGRGGMDPKELVPVGIRVFVRDMTSGIVLREIRSMWESEGFSEPSSIEPIGGERVSLYEAYIRQVDWTSHGEVARALRVFQETLLEVWNGWSEEYLVNRDREFDKLTGKIEAAGLEVSDKWLIQLPQSLEISPEDLKGLTDPGAIFVHLDRLSGALRDSDPELVIGQAKELVETTAKLILNERKVEYDPKLEMRPLLRKAQHSIGLWDGNQQLGPDKLQAVRQILNGAGNVAMGLAELRNSYGTGHGPGSLRSGLEQRHAELAVNAARLWCEMMLTTLSSETAPWRFENPNG